MNKAFLAVVVTFLLISGFGLASLFDVLLLRPQSVTAVDQQAEANLSATPPAALYQIFPVNPPVVPFRAKSWLVYDEPTGVILAAKEIDAIRPIASLTKMMTALVVRELLQSDLVISTPRTSTEQIGSTIGLVAGEQMTVENLLYGLLVQSGNDAAFSLASVHPGGLAGFVDRMNEKALELGLSSTRFSDPAGLDDMGYSTAREQLQISRLLLIDPLLATIVATPEIVISNVSGNKSHQLKNSNRLLNEFAYYGSEGVKTGFTPEAGHLLVAAASRGGHRLIAVVLSTFEDTKPASAIEAKKMLDWGFASLSSRQ